ncbi:hypothetical protein V6N11_032190 [Hibiscus sabdariffa]|uniref:Uncharacterized protein n=1 Tax=Hibiscus sabdariffa TaxID=183260 RepID=A0ABR2SZW5_9ROSI
MGFRHRPPLVRRTLIGLSFNLTSSSYFSVEFPRKVSQSSTTQNDQDGSGFELMGVAGVGSNELWNGIDFGGVGVFGEGADENDEGGELSML